MQQAAPSVGVGQSGSPTPSLSPLSPWPPTNMALAVPTATMSVFSLFAGDSMHMNPPGLQAFADSNGWCTAAIPEFQDVQRFIQRDTVQGPVMTTRSSYGPIVQTVASPTMATYTHTSQFTELYLLAAVAYVWDQPEAMKLPYTRLRLLKGLNCVFLKHSSAAGWGARTVHVDGAHCPTSQADIAAAPPIPVTTDDSAEAPGTIPAVARFVQSGDTATFLGVRCGALWCNIGASSPREIPPPSHLLASPPSTAQARVKGWFDEQQLGVPSSDGLGITPAAFATVIPVAGLKAITAGQFQASYQPVAKVFVSDTMSKYQSRMGFSKGWNTIAISGSEASPNWTAEVTDARGRKRYLYVHRFPHTIGSIPGTARWAWTWRDKDEWVWVACLVGCCLVQSSEDA